MDLEVKPELQMNNLPKITFESIKQKLREKYLFLNLFFFLFNSSFSSHKYKLIRRDISSTYKREKHGAVEFKFK
jgi:hypothetical protein